MFVRFLSAAWLNLSADSTNAFSILPHVLDSKLRQTLPAMCPGFRLLGTCFRSLGTIDQIADLPSTTSDSNDECAFA